MMIDGIKCKITIEVEYDESSSMPIDAKLDIKKTEDPLTESDDHPRCYFKWGGYPEFIQNEVCPMSDDGRHYKYICTINNYWGDAGNGNIFALLEKDWDDEDGDFVGFIVEDVYVEASCH